MLLHAFYNLLQVSQFLSTLERDLNKGVGSSLDSIIGQCMYFGLSFSRVGADFRGLLAPIFINTVTKDFEHAIRKASKKFEQDMENFSLPKAPNTSVPRNTQLSSQAPKQVNSYPDKTGISVLYTSTYIRVHVNI